MFNKYTRVIHILYKFYLGLYINLYDNVIYLPFFSAKIKAISYKKLKLMTTILIGIYSNIKV